jgi:hypothetical protein
MTTPTIASSCQMGLPRDSIRTLKKLALWNRLSTGLSGGGVGLVVKTWT